MLYRFIIGLGLLAALLISKEPRLCMNLDHQDHPMELPSDGESENEQKEESKEESKIRVDLEHLSFRQNPTFHKKAWASYWMINKGYHSKLIRPPWPLA